MPPPRKGKAEKLGPKKEKEKLRDSQVQNERGTKYSGKLADFMKKRNAPKKESNLDKSIRRRIEAGVNVVSPQDAAAVIGRYVGTDDAKKRFGSKNKATEAYSPLLNQQQKRLESSPYGARQFIESKDIFGRPLGTGKVAPAGENFILRKFNEAAGYNPTRGMGIMDSFRSNYEQSGAKFNRNQAIRGIIGSLIGGPLAGIALGNFIPEEERRPEGVNEFGFPIYDGRQIFEGQSTGNFVPVFEDPEVFDTTSVFPMMRPNMPRSFTPRTLRNTPRITTPRITAGTAGVRFGQGSVPKANRFGTAGSQFQNQRMLNQPLSKYGQVGTGQTAMEKFQNSRSFTKDLKNFFTKNPFGKRTPLGLGLGALGLLTGMTGNTGEATESSGGFMDTLGNVFDPSSEINQRPLFNFDPMEGIRSLFGLSEPASPAFDPQSFEGQPYDPAFDDENDIRDRFMQDFPNRIFNV